MDLKNKSKKWGKQKKGIAGFIPLSSKFSVTLTFKITYEFCQQMVLLNGETKNRHEHAMTSLKLNDILFPCAAKLHDGVV